MTTRKFYKYTFHYEVLSEEPMDYDVSLSDLQHLCYDGPCSGRMLSPDREVLDGQQAAHALQEQASDPEFFRIDSAGNDIEEVPDDSTNRK